jgi:hypothetical protein
LLSVLASEQISIWVEDATRRKQEQDMKLNSRELEQTLSQFQAEVLPENHPALEQLNGIYGDHTFLLDGDGLNVLEPAGAPEAHAAKLSILPVGVTRH